MTATTDFRDTPLASIRPATGDYSQHRIVPARYPARTVGTIVAALLIAATLNSVLGNPRWGWDVFAEWFLSEPVLMGLGRTLLLTLLGALFGFTLGTALALARVSGSPLLSGLSWTFTWIFRSIPLIVLLLILNNLGYLYEMITIGVPYTSINFFSYQTTQLISPFAAALLGLSINQAAFTSEIIRGGILSVDQGQLEAAASLGLPRSRQASRIILPQAMRSIVPPAFNDIIGLAKGTSNVYILALPELFYTIQVIYRRNLEVIPLLMVATVWYLVILSVLSAIQYFIERHYARGALRNPPPPVLRAILEWLGQFRFVSSPVPSPASVAAPRFVGTARSSVEPRGISAGERAAAGGTVTIHNVSKSFGQLKVLDRLSLTVPRAASPRSWASRAPASRRCCARSTISSASTKASSPSMASSSDTGKRAGCSTS
jgi:polar amino acid transport system permease protein